MCEPRPRLYPSRHPQKHKRNYRSWNSHAPAQPAHFGVAAGAGGIVPLPTAGWRERVSGPGFQPSVVRGETSFGVCCCLQEKHGAIRIQLLECQLQRPVDARFALYKHRASALGRWTVNKLEHNVC